MRLAALALLVSLYAINIVLLALALLSQVHAGASAGDGWVAALQRVARGGALAYAVWGFALTLALPWLF